MYHVDNSQIWQSCFPRRTECVKVRSETAFGSDFAVILVAPVDTM